MRHRALALLVACTVCPNAAPAAGSPGTAKFECGCAPPSQWKAALRLGIERGEIADPARRPLPELSPRRPLRHPEMAPVLTRAQVFPYEDTNQVLLTDFSDAQLLELMTEAANELLVTWGDNFDFIGFWINFVPDHFLGSAFFLWLENDISGLGDLSFEGTPIFNNRAAMGLAGENVEGYVTMWNINSPWWKTGNAPSADFTRLVLSHEFEHRWAVGLPSTLDGRSLQGVNDSCGTQSHWNWKVDGQGSCIEISEWVGQDPAAASGTFLGFNTDTGGVFSYTDLYLMGYVSPAEMDAGNSELRYMDDSDCSPLYSGTISVLSSADILEAAGPRVPGSTAAQHHFRTGWVMIHLPGAPPTDTELDKAIAILDQHMTDWNFGVLGRGTMNHTLFDDCNGNGAPDSEDIDGGASQDLDGNGFPDECDAACTFSFDCDGDGVTNLQDNCRFFHNPNQTDSDSDGLGNVCDNCVFGPNPTQGAAPFGQTVTAPGATSFCWSDPADVAWVRGDLLGISSYTIDSSGQETFATCLQDASTLLPGQGLYYVVRPDCAVGSWQTSFGAEPGRDAFLP